MSHPPLTGSHAALGDPAHAADPADSAHLADPARSAEAAPPSRPSRGRGRRVLRLGGAVVTRLRRPSARPALLATGVVLLTLVAAWVVVQPDRAADADDAAVLALDERRFGEARALAATARDRNPLSVAPLFTLGAVETAAGRQNEAHRAFMDAVDLQPANPITWQRLADFRLNVLRQPGPAVQAARAGIFLNPRSFLLAQLYIDATRAQGG